MAGTGSKETKSLEFKRECDEFKDIEALPLADDPDPVAQRKLSEWKGIVNDAIQASKQGQARIQEGIMPDIQQVGQR